VRCGEGWVWAGKFWVIVAAIVRHDLEPFVLGCSQSSGMDQGPFFRAANRKTTAIHGYRWSSVAVQVRGQTGRHAGGGRSPASICCQLACLPRPSESRRGRKTPACPRAYRPTAGTSGVSGDARTRPAHDLETAETRPRRKTPEFSMMSPALFPPVGFGSGHRACSAGRSAELIPWAYER
jgi:hypothetical protein